MVKANIGKNFCCLKCGEAFTCYPPDDYHEKASLTPKEFDDPIKVEYRCKGKECGYSNVLYWGHPKAGFALI